MIHIHLHTLANTTNKGEILYTKKACIKPAWSVGHGNVENVHRFNAVL